MRLRGTVLVTVLIAITAAPSPARAERVKDSDGCNVANSAGSPAERLQARSGGKKKQGQKKTRKKQAKVTLQADPQSAGATVNLGADREAEEINLRVNSASALPENSERGLQLVAEPFISTSETGETITFSEPSFSKLKVSGNRKLITFTMCTDAPNELPAGKYVSVVRLEGPPPTEGAVITVTLNAKDGGGFVIAAIFTFVLAYLVLLYKGAGERRAAAIATAKGETDAAERRRKVAEAESWWAAVKGCLKDLGWQVPTIAALGATFGVLWAAYAENPAWGEGGIVTSALALAGTGLAAVGARTVFTQTDRPSA